MDVKNMRRFVSFWREAAWQAGRLMPLDIALFGGGQGVVHIDAEEPHSALEFHVTDEQLPSDQSIDLAAR
jgi:hypothetical protein